MPSPPLLAGARRPAQVLTLAVGLAIALAALGSWAAWQAAARHRQTAEEAVHRQVALVAQSIANSAQAEAWFAIRTMLKVMREAGALGPLPAVEELNARATREALGPGYSLLSATRAFVADTAGGWTVSGAPLAPGGLADRRRLLTERIGLGAADGTPMSGATGADRFLYMLVGTGDSAAFLVAAPLDGAGRWHGFEVPLAQLRERILGTVASWHSVAAGDSSALPRLRITSPRGELLYVSDPPPAPPFLAPARMAGSLAATVEVSLPPGAAEQLVTGGLPASPGAWILGGFLLLAALLIAIGIAAWRTWRLGRLQAEFASSVTHELRTPLTQIQLFAETLQLERARSAESRRGAVDAIVRETRRLVQMVENVLAVSRVGRPSERLFRRPERVDQLVEEVMAGFAPLFRQRGITPVVLTGGPAIAAVDAEAVRRILINLVDNAVRHAPGGKAVTVSATLADHMLTLTVEDEGPGIPAGDADRLWRPYERGELTGGSGLGLAVVRRLVELCGGQVTLGRGQAGGARFVVLLPIPGDAQGDRKSVV